MCNFIALPGLNLCKVHTIPIGLSDIASICNIMAGKGYHHSLKEKVLQGRVIPVVNIDQFSFHMRFLQRGCSAAN